MNKEFTKTSFFNEYFKSLLETENINYEEEYKIKNTDVKELLKEYSYSKIELNLNRYFDFYLPDYKVAIECNGIYWHCGINGKNRFKVKYDLVSKTDI